jgi:L-threonylcarbamoyladenylate synthase
VLPPGASQCALMRNLSGAGDVVEAAANLFSHLRALDAAGPATIAVMPIPEDSLGEAINDRLRRAASPRS